MYGDLLQNIPQSVFMVVSATNEQGSPVRGLPDSERMHAFPILFVSAREAEEWIMTYGYADLYFSAITYSIIEYTQPPF